MEVVVFFAINPKSNLLVDFKSIVRIIGFSSQVPYGKWIVKVWVATGKFRLKYPFSSVKYVMLLLVTFMLAFERPNSFEFSKIPFLLRSVKTLILKNAFSTQFESGRTAMVLGKEVQFVAFECTRMLAVPGLCANISPILLIVKMESFEDFHIPLSNGT